MSQEDHRTLSQKMRVSSSDLASTSQEQDNQAHPLRESSQTQARRNTDSEEAGNQSRKNSTSHETQPRRMPSDSRQNQPLRSTEMEKIKEIESLQRIPEEPASCSDDAKLFANIIQPQGTGYGRKNIKPISYCICPFRSKPKVLQRKKHQKSKTQLSKVLSGGRTIQMPSTDVLELTTKIPSSELSFRIKLYRSVMNKKLSKRPLSNISSRHYSRSTSKTFLTCGVILLIVSMSSIVILIIAVLKIDELLQ